QTRRVIEAGRIVRDRRQIFVLVVGAHAAADEQAGRAHLVPAQGGAGARREAQAALQQVVAGETVHAEQGQVVQLGDLAVFVRDARVQVRLVGNRQLGHRLKDQVGRGAEAA